MNYIDLLELLQWIKANESLYWMVWLSAVSFVYVFFEGIAECISKWPKH